MHPYIGLLILRAKSPFDPSLNPALVNIAMKVIHNNCNVCILDLTDMYVAMHLSLRPVSLGLIHAYQITHAHVTTTTCSWYMHTYFTFYFVFISFIMITHITIWVICWVYGFVAYACIGRHNNRPQTCKELLLHLSLLTPTQDKQYHNYQIINHCPSPTLILSSCCSLKQYKHLQKRLWLTIATQ